MQRKYIIAFAGVPGSSKSIIAQHVSLNFNMPIFATDTVRFEVKEDLHIDDIREPHALLEYERRRQEVWKVLLATGRPFVLDASVDRRWAGIKSDLATAGYGWCLIAMELSSSFMRRLYRDTGRPEAVAELAVYMRQHQTFMNAYAPDIAIRITDETFADRKEIAQDAVSRFLSV